MTKFSCFVLSLLLAVFCWSGTTLGCMGDPCTTDQLGPELPPYMEFDSYNGCECEYDYQYGDYDGTYVDRADELDEYADYEDAREYEGAYEDTYDHEDTYEKEAYYDYQESINEYDYSEAAHYNIADSEVDEQHVAELEADEQHVAEPEGDASEYHNAACDQHGECPVNTTTDNKQENTCLHDEYEYDEYEYDEYDGHDEYGHDEYGHDEYGHDEYGHDEYGHDEYGHDEYGYEHEYEYSSPQERYGYPESLNTGWGDEQPEITPENLDISSVGQNVLNVAVTLAARSLDDLGCTLCDISRHISMLKR